MRLGNHIIVEQAEDPVTGAVLSVGSIIDVGFEIPAHFKNKCIPFEGGNPMTALFAYHEGKKKNGNKHDNRRS